MIDSAPPSGNQANNESLAGLLEFAFSKLLQQTDGHMPAQVLTYDPVKNRAKLQVLIPYVTTIGQQLKRATVGSVPVVQVSGGGFVMNVPIAKGDLGWIRANDRDITNFKATLTQAAPNTQRKHSFQDACFFPDAMRRGITIASEDQGNLVIQNFAGTVKLAFWSTFIKLISQLGIGGNPASSALLHLFSTNKASIPWPLMTQSQRDAIPSPQEGMVIWNTTTHGTSSYNGTTWS